MTTPAEVAVKDASTSSLIPVEGIPVTESLSNPTAGQVFRQSICIADGSGATAATNYAGVSNNAVQTLEWNTAPTTGTMTAVSTGVSVNISAGCTGVNYAVTGTWAGTLTLQASYDNSAWVAINDISGASTITANKTGVVLTPPYQYFRVQCTTYTSGTVSVSLQSVSNTGTVLLATAGNYANIEALLSDGNAASTGLATWSQGLLYNGSTWDRARSDGTGIAKVSLYGKQTTAGDTVLVATSSGALKVDASAVTQPVSIATAPALVASNAKIGNVGGSTAKIAVTPTITASSYTAGFEVGGLMTFSSALLTAGSGVLESISIRCKSVQTTPLILFLFDANPTNSTWTNHAAPAINAADIPFLVGAFELATAFSNLGTHTIYNLNGISQALAPGATTLYGVLVTLGTPTYASTSDITVVLGILQD